MKVDRPRARLSDAPTRLNKRSTMPILARARRDEAAGLGQHRDQRRLAKEGRLAAHVGAGDQPQPVVGTERAIIGDEALAAVAERGFDDRMPPALDLEAGLVGELRRAPSAFGGAVSVAGGDVDAGNGVGGGGDLRRGGYGEGRQLLGVRGFGGERVGAGLDHPARFLVQLGRIEADHAGQRLAMGEAAVRRHQPVGVPGRDLDMIAEHRIVADLERSDSGRVAIFGLERGNRAAAVGGGVAQSIERGVIAFRDVAALRSVDRRRFDQGRAQAVDQRRMAAKARQQLVQQWRPVWFGFELGLQRRSGREAIAE